MKFVLLVITSLVYINFGFTQESSNNSTQPVSVTFDSSTNEVKFGDSLSYSLEESEIKSYTKALAEDPLAEANHMAYGAYNRNNQPLSEKEKFDQVKNRLEMQRKALMTPKGIMSSYLHQSFLFFFWLGAAQVYNCYTDYAANPMACFQFLMTEAQGIHRAGLLAFVVASGLIHTSPWVYGLGKRVLKSDRYTQSYMSALSLGLGVSAQSVLMTVLQYYLKDENVKKCSRLYILKEAIKEEKRWGKKITHDEAILENDPCRLAEDRSTLTYMKNSLPGEILSLWATMPILFLVESLIHTAVSPQGITVPVLKKLTDLVADGKSLNTGSKLTLLISLEKILTKLEPTYKMAFNFKSKSKIFKVAQFATTPGTWLYSGFNLITFTYIHHKIMPYFMDWHFNNTNNFEENNRSLQLFSDMSLDSITNQQFITDPNCNDANKDTCEPQASKLITSLRSDFARWRELKLQSFVLTYQGWQEKIQSLIRSFNVTKNTYVKLTTDILDSKAGDKKPWEVTTVLRGVSPLVPENSNDAELLDNPHYYYGPKSERAFIIGVSLKLFLKFITQELKIDKKFDLEKVNKSEKAQLLLKEIESFKDLAAKANQKIIDYGPRISLVTQQGDKLVGDFTDFFNSTMKELESNSKSNLSSELNKWKEYAKNKTFIEWLDKINGIANKLTSGFLLDINQFPSEWLHHYTTAVKKYVQMPENHEYHREMIDPDDVESSFSMDEPIKSLGISNELLIFIKAVSKNYFQKILRDSPYQYYLPRANYSIIQEGLNEFVNIVEYMNHSGEAKVQSSLIIDTFPKLEEWGWISRRGTENFLKLENKFREWIFQHPLTFLARKTAKVTPFIDLIKLTNTIYLGLGSPYSSANEVVAYKERFKRYTTAGRNSLLYNFPYTVNKIVTETPFDSVVVGLLCGVDDKNKAYKVTKFDDKDSLNVDYEDFFPDSFTPFRLVSPDNPEVKKFCSKSISKQDDLDAQLPELISLIEKLVRKQELSSLEKTIIDPKYTNTLVGLYCDLNDKAISEEISTANMITNKTKAAEGSTYFSTASRSWELIDSPWKIIENKICKNKQENTLSENDFNASEITALFHWTQNLFKSLSKDSREQVLSKYLKFSSNHSQNDRIDAYKNLQKLAILQFIAINGAEYLESVLNSYQELYNRKLPLLADIFLGKNNSEKDKTQKIIASNLDFDLVDYDIKNYGEGKINIVKGNRLLDNVIEESVALSLLQESSYYLSFLTKFLSFQLKNPSNQNHTNYQIPTTSFYKNSIIPPIITYLQDTSSIDPVTKVLPIAPNYVWRLNSLITSSLALIATGDVEKAYQTLSVAYQLIDYLDIFVFGVNLYKGNYATEKDLNELAKSSQQIIFNTKKGHPDDSNNNSTSSSNTLDEEKSQLTPLNLNYSQKAVLRTWLVQYKNLINDIQSIRGMIQPLTYENAVNNNTFSN